MSIQQTHNNTDMGDINNGTNGHSHNGKDFFDKIAKTGATSDCTKLEECFEYFDSNGKGYLSRADFDEMLSCLFQNCGKPYDISDDQKAKMFMLMDENQDGQIDEDEFQVVWYHWFKQILDPISAFVLVDVQNDFISGSLSISNCPAEHDGEEVVPVINKLLDAVEFDTTVYTLDWHPKDHISFIENVKDRPFHNSSAVSQEEAKTLDTVVFDGSPPTEQILWPAHCVQETWGAEVHKDLKVVEKSFIIKKGTNSEVDSYSAFWDNNKYSKTTLEAQLTEMGVTDCYVCGIAYDVCVGATAKHALEHGFRTVLVDDASRGVAEAAIEATKKKLEDNGGMILHSDCVANMVSALDRRPELGYQAALNVALAKRLVKADKHQREIQQRNQEPCRKGQPSNHQHLDVTIQ